MSNIEPGVGIEEEPLIKALPPATDYLTYLTILEYQLTPDRLPLLHQLLRDETLTSSIGWDLVKLLLPMLPDSLECLQDVARLGNPREVILRVSDALMSLEEVEAEDEDEDNEDGDTSDAEDNNAKKKTPLHVSQFSALLSMLSVLHSRIKTKSPSRFVASSLHAALEAYTTFPTEDTTASFLEFLRSVSPKKRPSFPPRSRSDQHVATSTASGGPSAPDPEAEAHLEDFHDEEQSLIQRYVQFGLVEALKAYVLHCTAGSPPGMQWALRLQEKLALVPTPDSLNVSRMYAEVGYLKQRDITIGKILALSTDIGLGSGDLLQIVLERTDGQPPPWDFEETVKSPADIPLERRGCLLLLAAKYANSILLQSEREKADLTVMPDLSAILSNLLGHLQPADIDEQPVALIDSILTLAIVAHRKNPSTKPIDALEFKQLLLRLISCTNTPSFQRILRAQKIASNIFHAPHNAAMRFQTVRSILQDDNISPSTRECALRWLKEELVQWSNSPPESTENPFLDAAAFAALLPRIQFPNTFGFDTIAVGDPSLTPQPAAEKYTSLYLAAFNLYFFMLKSEALRERLDMGKIFDGQFRAKYIDPLKVEMRLLHENKDIISRAETQDMGTESLEMARVATDVVCHIIGEVEQAMDEEDYGK